VSSDECQVTRNFPSTPDPRPSFVSDFDIRISDFYLTPYWTKVQYTRLVGSSYFRASVLNAGENVKLNFDAEKKLTK